MNYFVSLPSFLRPYRRKAIEWLQQQPVIELEFSGVTYQLLIEEVSSSSKSGKPAGRYWVFLQLDDEGELSDAFCSCEEERELESPSRGCIHLAVAYLALYGKSNRPLHRRFALSLWHHLCYLFSERLGDEAEELFHQLDDGSWAHESASGKSIVRLHPKTEEAAELLYALLFERPHASEETSIKFSQLPREELLSWQRGDPTPQMSYELSFWSDLAKQLMWKQELGCPYSISFDEIASPRPPHHIFIDFDELSLSFYLSEANWPSIIPSLATVQSPLCVYEAGWRHLHSLRYDELTSTLHLEHDDSAKSTSYPRLSSEESSFYLLGNWQWHPSVGFVACDPHRLLSKSELVGSQIAELFDELGERAAELLEGTTLHTESLAVSHQLHFDKEWNLQISCYLLEPGDLTAAHSRLFGSWVYLEGEGFFRTAPMPFPEPHFIVPEEQVGQFVTLHKSFLNKIEGFGLHLPSVEEQLHYQVDSTGHLLFSLRMAAPLIQGVRHHHFGPWLYIEESGFYPKSGWEARGPLRAGLRIPPEQLPLFLEMHRQELEMIPGLFASRQLLEESYLQLSLSQDGSSRRWSLAITPCYRFSQGVDPKAIRFYGDYFYLPGEGFSLISPRSRLPEEYNQPQQLTGRALQKFLTYELASIEPLLKEKELRLYPPKEPLQLHLASIEADPERPGYHRVGLFFTSEEGRLPVAEVWKAFQRKERFLPSVVGCLDLSQPPYRWIDRLAEEQLSPDGTLLLSTLELVRLGSWEAIQRPSLAEVELPAEPLPARPMPLLEQLEEVTLGSYQQLPLPSTPTLHSQLRPYQQVGLQWLWFLYSHGLSGLLCDDMGLGKTHQAMALISAIEAQQLKEAAPLRFFVVCPTSVLYHWQDKLHQFLPSIDLHLFYGAQRTLEDLPLDRSLLLLTSYGTLRKESHRLATLFFDLAIFDEIQLAKNSQSRIHRSVRALHAKMRLGMSGTPLENYLRELEALFDLVLPGYLPPEREFRLFFIQPIEKENNEERLELLKRVIAPFILRRKKEQVLTDLPEKSEEIAHCTLYESQRTLYNELLQRSQERFFRQLENEVAPIPYLHIFSLLSALKQVCDHPAVYYKEPHRWKEYKSGKWDLFCELLDEAHHSNQKVVVFSQYLQMLDIIALYLEERNIGYSQIRGSTKDRQGQLQKFQTDPQCRLFLASLQAAGTGIDLTSGSVVIHYDRWWNAAREEQATDRIYRIGQKRGVQVFKLVTKDTFEERIDQLIERKRQRMEATISATDEKQLLYAFTRQELRDLFKQAERGYHEEDSE